MSGNYFTGDRDFWDDPDFDTAEKKIVYAVLWQSAGIDISGVRMRNDPLLALRSGLTLKRFQDTLSIAYRMGKVWVYDDVIGIKPALWHNLNHGSYSERQMLAVVARLRARSGHLIVRDIIDYNKSKYALEIPYTYPMDTLCIPITPYTVTDTVTLTVTDTDAMVPREKTPASPARAFLTFFGDLHKAKFNSIYICSFKKDTKIVKDLIDALGEDELKKRTERFFNDDDEFLNKAGHTIGVLKSRVNSYSDGSWEFHGLTSEEIKMKKYMNGLRAENPDVNA